MPPPPAAFPNAAPLFSNVCSTPVRRSTPRRPVDSRPLHSAVQKQGSASIDVLVARGADMHHAADDGRTPFSMLAPELVSAAVRTRLAMQPSGSPRARCAPVATQTGVLGRSRPGRRLRPCQHARVLSRHPGIGRLFARAQRSITCTLTISSKPSPKRSPIASPTALAPRSASRVSSFW